MTEEDQLLVTKAALLGVRFSRNHDGYWVASTAPVTGRLTIGRAAINALRLLGMATEDEQDAYDRRTWNLNGPVNIDYSALAGCQLQAEEPNP